MSTVTSPYKMTISLNVLNHLGIGLYSNVPAVLSEIVANAWDADAEQVHINIDPKESTITIQDSGFGMNLEDINKKYLTVGYTKRTNEPPLTPKGRSPMGRKGIGKLSVFSIADVAEIYSVKVGEKNAFKMVGEDIQTQIKDGATHDYLPDPLDVKSIDFKKGTLIKLSKIKKGLSTAEVYLKKRLARRFSVIGKEHDFMVYVNGKEINAKDRDFFDHIEFIWCLGKESEKFSKLCNSLEKNTTIENIVDTNEGYKVTGWIGTVDERKNVDDQNNSIVIFAHGKLIQEDVLKDFKEGGVYSKYIIGEIDADFMDLNEKDDVVTSDRQRVKEDDERYEKLKEYIWSVLKKVQREWTELRNQVGTKRALAQPIIQEWYKELEGDNKKYAEKLFGKLESLNVPDPVAKKELYKASILAFEKLALKNALSILDSLETEKDFDLIAGLFKDIDELEAAHYYQIIKGRLEVVKQFEKILPDAQERVIQKHIFNHLWLLDPSWERAASNQRIEQAVTKEFKNVDAKLTKEEREGRIDIRYKTAAGKHIIIELKKYKRSVEVTELLTQVRKYKSALEKCLKEKFPNESRVIECICITGSPPEPRDKEEENIEMLQTINARYITYDTLIKQTLDGYEEYLTKEREMSRIIEIIERLDESLFE